MILSALLFLVPGPVLNEPVPAVTDPISTTSASAVAQAQQGLRFVGEYAPPDEPLSIWSRSPATKFVEAYPVGNGRLGATMFGGLPTDRIVLNENTLWSGSPQDADRADANKRMPEIVELLKAGKNVEAQKLADEVFTCAGKGSGDGNAKDLPYGCYQILGDLEITMLEPDGSPLAGEIKNYRRTLDIKAGAAYTRYEHKGAIFTRRMFASVPDQIVGYRIAVGNGARRISFDAQLSRKERAKSEAIGDLGLLLTGTLSDGKGGDGMGFNARVLCDQRGGTQRCENGVLQVRGADEVFLVIAMGTSYSGPVQGQWSGNGHVAMAQQTAEKALAKGYLNIWKDWYPQWRAIYERSLLDLGPSPRSKMPTLERLEAAASGESDPQLASLYFAYARFLMMSGSRFGSLPANLQGLWADDYQTPWNGDYHLDINLQMNYAFTGAGFLGECSGPLGAFLMSLPASGAKTAKAYYNADGWVAHTITNPWGFTSPGERSAWGQSITGGAWLANSVYDICAYSQDLEALRKVYPALKGAAEFHLATLVEDPKTKKLVTPISISPENEFKVGGGSASLCMGPTIDQAIIRDLFTNVADAARALATDFDFAKRLDEAKAKLAPLAVGKNGGVREWLEDVEAVDPKHRHVSQLYALYPSDQINLQGTPDLAKAAKVTLEQRGDEGTGWSLAWKATHWARLGEGDRALSLLKRLWRPTTDTTMNVSKGGTYPNLFCAHPPFQIDGNFGGATAICELLVQSYREKPGEDYTLHLLPALPKEWPTGQVTNLGARGGLAVTVQWKDGRLEKAYVWRGNDRAANVRVRCNEQLVAKKDGTDVGGAYVDGVYVFPLEPRVSVELSVVR